MPGWNTYNGLTYADSPTGVAGQNLSDNFEWLAKIAMYIQQKSANYTAQPGDLVVCDVSSASFTVTLPASPGENRRVGVKLQTGSGSNTVTVARNTGQAIGGQAVDVKLFVETDYLELQYDDTNDDWLIVVQALIPHTAKMYRNTVQTITSGSSQAIDFDTVEYDTANIADTSNNQFKIRRAGVYLVMCSWWVSGLNDGKWCEARIYRNGGSNLLAGRCYSPKSNGGLTAPSQNGFDLAVDDTILFHVQQNNGSSLNTLTSRQYRPQMSITEIR